jgi:hypothetical protein
VLELAGAEAEALGVSEVDVELDDVVVRPVDVVVVARGLVVVVRGTVRGVVTFGRASTGCGDETDAGRTRMYSARVATNTSVTTAVERRTRARFTGAVPRPRCRCRRAG